MNEATVIKLNQMNLKGMCNAFKSTIENGNVDRYTIDQMVSILVDAESANSSSILSE